MPTYKIKLLKKETIANGTMAFHFEKPEGFTYRAGQFGDFTLIDPSETDAEGNMRGFSLASAPHEPDLMVSTRMRDTAFKRVLKELPEGNELEFDGPYGNFTLHKTLATPAVFLIGGIGITPVRSMIAQATKDRLEQKLTLLYSNRTPQDAAFLDELTAMAQQNENFTFVPAMTEAQDWSGEKGYITKDMLQRHVPDITTPIYYLSGPAAMVAAMRQMLIDAGVNEDNIRTEEFAGY